MGEALIAALATEVSTGADIAIAEGVMGLFDGAAARGRSGSGATADLACSSRLAGGARARRHRTDRDGRGRREWLRAIQRRRRYRRRHSQSRRERATFCADRAGVRADQDAGFRRDLARRSSRLARTASRPGPGPGDDGDRRSLDALSDVIGAAIDLDAIRQSARPAKAVARSVTRNLRPIRLRPPGQRIALAQDRAFSFMYPHLLRQWRLAGAEIIPFSPLANEAPDADRRRRLVARRLSGASRRHARDRPHFPRRSSETRPPLDSDPRRVRWLYGVGTRA